MTDHIKHWFDLGSLMILLGTLVDWMPRIASVLTVIWLVLRIYEAATGNPMFGKRRQ